MSTPKEIGLTALQRGDAQAAIGALETAIAQTPDDYQALTYLGGAYAQAGRNMEAINTLTQAVTVQPSNGQARYNLGIAMEQAGYREQALQAMEQAIQLQPDYVKAHEALSRLRSGTAMAQSVQTVPQTSLGQPAGYGAPAQAGGGSGTLLPQSPAPQYDVLPASGAASYVPMPQSAPSDAYLQQPAQSIYPGQQAAPSSYGQPVQSPSPYGQQPGALPGAMPQTTYPQPAAYNAPSPLPGAYSPPQQTGLPSHIGQHTPNPAYTPLSSTPVPDPNIIGAAFVGGLLAIVCGFATGKLAVAMGVRLGIINVAMGYLIGYAVLKTARESGPIQAMIGGLCALSAALLGQYIIYSDISAQITAMGVPLPWNGFLDSIAKMNPINWLFLIYAFYRGYRIPSDN